MSVLFEIISIGMHVVAVGLITEASIMGAPCSRLPQQRKTSQRRVGPQISSRPFIEA
jgi:hypothetical protein